MKKNTNDIDYLKQCGDVYKYENIQSKLLWGQHSENVRFSIYIPTFKRLELLKQAVLSAINQKEIENYEIVIVDNDDNFNNLEVLEYVRNLNCSKIVYYKNEKNIGIYGNTLRGATLSNGKYVALLNDDDLLHPYYLYIVNLFIEKYGYYGVIGTVPISFTGMNYRFSALPRVISAYKVSKKEFFFGCTVTSPGLMYPKKVIEDIYNAYEQLLMGDQIIQYKALVKYGLFIIRVPLAAYRISENATFKSEVLEQMLVNMCRFRKQTSKDDLALRWFMRWFYKEYCFEYVSSATEYWKKRSVKRQVLRELNIDKINNDSLKSMTTSAIIYLAQRCAYKLRLKFHDAVTLQDRIILESDTIVNKQ